MLMNFFPQSSGPTFFAPDATLPWGRRDRMIVGFSTTYAIITYYHLICEFEPVQDKVYSINIMG